MGRYKVHAALTGPTTNLGTFGDAPDRAGFFAADENAMSGPVANLSAALQVRRQRDADMVQGNQTRSIGGPAPDMAWDGFFGALQQKEQRAEDHGLRFRAELAGRGPGTGIGSLSIHHPSGLTENPLAGVSSQNPSLTGLQYAADRVSSQRRHY